MTSTSRRFECKDLGVDHELGGETAQLHFSIVSDHQSNEPIPRRNVGRNIHIVLEDVLVVLVHQSSLSIALVIQQLLVQVRIVTEVFDENIVVHHAVNVEAQGVASYDGVGI